MSEKSEPKQEKKKGLLGKLIEKLDKKMVEKSQKSSCCGPDKSKGSSCC